MPQSQFVDIDTLEREILENLSKTTDGMSGDDLYSDSSIAEDRMSISKAVSNLRQGGKVVAKKHNEKRIFLITKEGLSWISGKPVATITDNAKKEKTKGASIAMVPMTEDGFQCMLTPEGNLMFNFFDIRAGKINEFSLNPDQVTKMWPRLAAIYPRLVHKK